MKLYALILTLGFIFVVAKFTEAPKIIKEALTITDTSLIDLYQECIEDIYMAEFTPILDGNPRISVCEISPFYGICPCTELESKKLLENYHDGKNLKRKELLKRKGA